MQTHSTPAMIALATEVNTITLEHNSKAYTAYRYTQPANIYEEYFLVGSTGEYVKLIPMMGHPNQFGLSGTVLRTRGCFKGTYTGTALGTVRLHDGLFLNPAPITFA